MPEHGQISYDVIKGNVDRIGINFNELPKLPFWTPLLGKTDADVRIAVTSKVMSGSAAIGRELSQDEKNALAQHYAQLLRTESFNVPLAIGSGYYFYRRSYSSYGFPFFTPKPEKFNPNNFPLLGWKDKLARAAWHNLRLMSWLAACKFSFGILCLSYAVAQHTKHYSTDPRLQAYRTEYAARKINLEPLQRPRQPSNRAAPSTTAWNVPEQSTRDAQDSEPTWPGTQSPQPESPPASDPDESYAFLDDASPVSPAESQGAPTQQRGAQGGSAWDRIRSQARGGSSAQGQGSGSQATAWRRRRDDEITSRGAQQGTSYTFSPADEERAYAKAQAQKEFDAMLEKERRGQSDTSGKRW